MIEGLIATGDNTVYTLTDEERAAFAALTALTSKIVDELGAENLLATMQGN